MVVEHGGGGGGGCDVGAEGSSEIHSCSFCFLVAFLFPFCHLISVSTLLVDKVSFVFLLPVLVLVFSLCIFGSVSVVPRYPLCVLRKVVCPFHVFVALLSAYRGAPPAEP